MLIGSLYLAWLFYQLFCLHVTSFPWKITCIIFFTGPEDSGRLRSSSPDREDQPHHPQNALDHHPHHHSHHHPHHHHHHHPSSADHLRQQRTDHNKSPVGGVGVNGGFIRGSPYGPPPPTSLAALQRTQPSGGPLYMPYPTSMAHRMTLPTMTSAPAEGLPGLRPNHAFAPSSISSSSTTSSTTGPINSPRSTSSPLETPSKDSSSTVTNNNITKPKIWSLADIVTSNSSSSSSNTNAPSITSASSPGKPSPVRPNPGGAGLPHSALGSLRAWTEATGGPYGLAAAVAAAQGLPHPYSRAGPMPPHGVAGIPTMPGAFSLPPGIPLMHNQHQNGFYTNRPGRFSSVDLPLLKSNWFTGMMVW